MSAWRVIITDSESFTGVAPVCEHQGDRTKHTPNEFGDDPDPGSVFDCCPHPHLETWSEAEAKIIANVLTGSDVQVCS